MQYEKSIKQFIKFGIVGLSNTAVSYGIYIGLLKLFEYRNILPRYDYLVSSVVAFLLSVLWSFYWNNRFTFKAEENEKRCLWKTLLKTYISYSLTGVLLHNALLLLGVQVLGISKDIMPLINLIFTVPLNFWLNKKWAFKADK